jgi:hypothetical protein
MPERKAGTALISTEIRGKKGTDLGMWKVWDAGDDRGPQHVTADIDAAATLARDSALAGLNVYLESPDGDDVRWQDGRFVPLSSADRMPPELCCWRGLSVVEARSPHRYPPDPFPPSAA